MTLQWDEKTKNTLPDMLEWALAYIRAGFHIMPVFSIAMLGEPERIMAVADGPSYWRRCLRYCLMQIGKTPLRPWYVHRTIKGNHIGCWSATCVTEEEAIRWFTAYPKANIGIVTGRFSGIAVLDVDFYRGGEHLLPALKLSATRTVSTGGGEHYYFVHPDGKYRTRHRIGGVLSIVADEYTFVVAPPSLHSSGKRYRWMNAEVPIAPVPESLCHIMDRALPMAPLLQTYKIIRYSIRRFFYGYICYPVLRVFFRTYFYFIRTSNY